MLSRSRKAFTLLELIVVIVILGILAALAIPTFAAVIKKARVSTAISAAESVGRDAIALAAFEGDPVSLTDLQTILTGPNAEVDGVTLGAFTPGTPAVEGPPATPATPSTVVLTINEINVELTFTGNSVKGEKA